MLENLFGFYETEHSFNDVSIDYLQLAKMPAENLLVKAHEKEIYQLGENLIVAKIHRDNNGEYPFSKLDFLSHKIQEIVYHEIVPKVYAADFSDNDKPIFVVERVPLDKYHIAYNISRQKAHQKDGLDYKYNSMFLYVEANESIDELANEHIKMVDAMKKKYIHLLDEKGIAFDYSYVNIAWRNSRPVALEIHKCQRDYLFNYDKCYKYFELLAEDSVNKEVGIQLLKRIRQLL